MEAVHMARLTLGSSPRVSVVMGTYNQERYVREALDSIGAQTYRDYEIIVVDDASTDGTVDILKSYGGALRLFELPVNSGGCQFTRNRGIKEARGEFIAFLDHDDAWHPRKLEQQVRFMDAHPAIPLSHTYCRLMDEGSHVLNIRHEGRLRPTGDIYRDLLNHCFITMCTVMARRSLFDDVGYFDEDLPVVSEDYEFFLRVATRHPIGFMDEVLAFYRKSASGITSRWWKYQPEVVPFYRWYLGRRDLWGARVPRRDIVRALVNACLENACFWRLHHYPARAAYFAVTGLRRAPMRGALARELVKALASSCVRP